MMGQMPHHFYFNQSHSSPNIPNSLTYWILHFLNPLIGIIFDRDITIIKTPNSMKKLILLILLPISLITNAHSIFSGNIVADSLIDCNDPFATNYNNNATGNSECIYFSCESSIVFENNLTPNYFDVIVSISGNLIPNFLLNQNGMIGAFIQNEQGDYTCIGQTVLGDFDSFPILADDPITDSIEGPSDNDPLHFFIITEQGHLFKLVHFEEYFISYGVSSNDAYVDQGTFMYQCYEPQALGGCTDSLACNYNEYAVYDIDICDYDDDGDGICNEDEIEGCLDPDACNYNPNATDISCITWDVELTYDSVENKIVASISRELMGNWKLNGESITNSNWLGSSPFIIPEENGIYTLVSVYEYYEIDPAWGWALEYCIREHDIEITTLSINEFHSSIKAHPNPANDLVYIEGPSGSKIILNVYSITGDLILTESLQDINTNIDVGKFDNGLYLFKISDGTNESVHKIKIQH